MIFVTIGTQHPFDRLIEIIDSIAATIDEPVVAQTLKGNYKPQHISTFDFVSPVEFNRYTDEARVIVAHAGMGVILSAMELGKPVVIFPREVSLGEDINSHQLATAAKMSELGYVYCARDEQQMRELLTRQTLPALHTIGQTASDTLVASLRSYIDAL